MPRSYDNLVPLFDGQMLSRTIGPIAARSSTDVPFLAKSITQMSNSGFAPAIKDLGSDSRQLTLRLTQLISFAHRHWSLMGVLTAYIVGLFVIPTLAPVPISDDWIYAVSVQDLVQHHTLHILNISVVTAVFQVIWGTLFALVFGTSFGVLRVSSVILVLVAGIALYRLLLELGVPRARSALGAAAYLFNPLSVAISFTFMTDPQFTALLIISTLFYVRGVKKGSDGNRDLIVGSIFAALSFLVRQQGALIPVGVAAYLLASHRLRMDWRSLLQLLRVGSIPALSLCSYYVWLIFINGVPHEQQGHLQAALSVSLRSTAGLVGELALVGVMYVGFFIFPIALAAFRNTLGLRKKTSRAAVALLVLWVVALIIDIETGLPSGMRMPYVPHFMTRSGLGPSDLIVNRPSLFSNSFLAGLTLLCGVASLVFAIAVSRQATTVPSPERSAAGLILSLAVWQAVGVIPPSFAFRDGFAEGHIAPSLDRYLLPLLPMAICLLLWATRSHRIMLPLGWCAIAIIAAFSIVGTRDGLVLQEATWKLDQQANQLGVLNTQLDGGAAWDGYHVYKFSQAHQSQIQTPSDQPRTWWLYIWAPATDSSFIVSAGPVPQFVVVKRVEYSQWLHRGPSYLYLLRRDPQSQKS